uniref:Uncharacterized protein n=1 Tax=Opuntia streptacantha TaxID=393608 RepID=A0A7C9F1W3_OPUST
MLTKGSMSHVIIYEDHFLIFLAVSKQRDKMAVTKLGKHLNFCLELMYTLFREWVPTLDSYFDCTPINFSPVDFTKASNSKDKRLIKVFGGSFNFSEREVTAEVRGERRGITSSSGCLCRARRM